MRVNGDRLDNETKVASYQHLFYSIFSGIDLYLNNKLTASNMDTYPYRTYLFSFGSDVSDNQVKAAEFWYEVEPGEFKDFDHANVRARIAPFKLRKPLELQGRLHLDLTMQENIGLMEQN